MDPDNHLYRELEVETKPQMSWTAVYGGGRGLAVVSIGLLESAVRDQPERTLALTLMRSTRTTVLTNGEPNGQLLGDWTFRYWLAPLAGAPDRVRLSRLGQQVAAGVRSVQLRREDLPLLRQAASLPASGSMVEVDGSAVVTSARWVDGAFEVRMFNPADAAGAAQLRFGAGLRFARMQQVDSESSPLGPEHSIVGGEAAIPLAAKQIKTLRFS